MRVFFPLRITALLIRVSVRGYRALAYRIPACKGVQPRSLHHNATNTPKTARPNGTDRSPATKVALVAGDLFSRFPALYPSRVAITVTRVTQKQISARRSGSQGAARRLPITEACPMDGHRCLWGTLDAPGAGRRGARSRMWKRVIPPGQGRLNDEDGSLLSFLSASRSCSRIRPRAVLIAPTRSNSFSSRLITSRAEPSSRAISSWVMVTSRR